VAKIEITRTELVWPGKYNEDGTLKEVPRVNLPFQVIERVNESRASREARKNQTLSLFDIYEGREGDTFEEGWRNKLIWGDNLLVMGSLLEKFASKIDLIYIDPRLRRVRISRLRRRSASRGRRSPRSSR
jgi:adenine specific DNA methylase Mod